MIRRGRVRIGTLGFTTLIFLSVYAPTLRGLEGYYTEEEVRTYAPQGGPDKIVTRKSWYADQRMRKDEAWMGTTIARFDLNRIYILDSHSKTYYELSPDVLQELAASELQNFGALTDAKGNLYFPEDLLQRTETVKEIGHWSCYQVMTNPSYRKPEAPYVIFWYSTEVDFPVAFYGDQLRDLFGDSPAVEGLFNRIKSFEGYPVRTEMHGVRENVMTTLYKFERIQDLDPGLFEVPQDYQAVPLPEDLPAPRSKP